VELGETYKTNANGEPIDRWNEHDLPDAERERLIAKLTNRCTESASLRELKQLYFNDKWDLFSNYSDEELLSEWEG
jgi:hypothetical protein